MTIVGVTVDKEFLAHLFQRQSQTKVAWIVELQHMRSPALLINVEKSSRFSRKRKKIPSLSTL